MAYLLKRLLKNICIFFIAYSDVPTTAGYKSKVWACLPFGSGENSNGRFRDPVSQHLVQGLFSACGVGRGGDHLQELQCHLCTTSVSPS